MKQIRNIYPKIITKENLYRSAHLAARGRRYRDTTADFNFHLEDEIQQLQDELRARTYRHGKYRHFYVYEPKKRFISAAPFRDRVVHHAVHDVIEPLIDESFIYDSYACRKGKGTHRAVDRAQQFLRANRFCFHGDIRKYFPSIDHGVLKELVERKVKDKDLLWLLDEIIDSADRPTGQPANRLTGLPIGNLTSQFFANLYLNELDYFIKFELRLRYYLRYMDDLLVFGNERQLLQEVRNRIREFLSEGLKLKMHEGKSQIYPTSQGIKFLGFRLFKDYRRLTSDNVRRFKRRLLLVIARLAKPAEAISKEKIRDSVRCWVAHAKYANTAGLRRKIVNRLTRYDGYDDSFGEMLRSEIRC